MELEKRLSEDSPLLNGETGSKAMMSTSYQNWGQRNWIRWGFLFLTSLAGIVALVVFRFGWRGYRDGDDVDSGVSIAFVGNSMFYFNGKKRLGGGHISEDSLVAFAYSN